MNPHLLLILLPLVGVLTACDREPAQRVEQAEYEIGQRLEPVKQNGADEADNVTTLEWDNLVPPEYDPLVLLEGMDLNTLDDDDPKAKELLNEMQSAWANAPVVENLDGKRVRIPGFMVPLDGDAETVSEMLLVPYFGACIHVPPPPSNQIIHVAKMSPINRETAYDAVWVQGVLKTKHKQTDVGSAGYTLEAESVEPYE